MYNMYMLRKEVILTKLSSNALLIEQHKQTDTTQYAAGVGETLSEQATPSNADSNFLRDHHHQQQTVAFGQETIASCGALRRPLGPSDWCCCGSRVTLTYPCFSSPWEPLSEATTLFL